MSLYKTLIKNWQSLSAFSIAILAITFSHNALATIDESIENALKFGQEDAKYGQIKFDLRYRYENAILKAPQKKRLMQILYAYVLVT